MKLDDLKAKYCPRLRTHAREAWDQASLGPRLRRGRLLALNGILDGKGRRWLEGQRMKLDPWGTWLHSDYCDDPALVNLPETNETRQMGVSVDKANLIASPIPGDEKGRHIFIADIDFPARWVPSSTPGKGHLYVNVPMSEDKLLRGLEGLVKAGIVHRNYLIHSTKRGYANVRPPWVRKMKADGGFYGVTPDGVHFGGDMVAPWEAM